MSNLLGAINPIAFSLGPLDVYWYGIIIAVGIFSAIFLSTREAEKEESKEIISWIWLFGHYR